jgi:hypothetical protein
MKQTPTTHAPMASRASSAASTFLVRERDAITTAAETALMHRHEQHYATASKEAVRQRLEALYDQLLAAVSSRDLTSVVAYADSVAEERFQTGYDLSEVQAGFNALEEATWKRILTELQPEEYAEALGLVSTVFGAAKDELGRRYVSLATRTHAPSLDLTALFGGTDSA